MPRLCFLPESSLLPFFGIPNFLPAERLRPLFSVDRPLFPSGRPSGQVQRFSVSHTLRGFSFPFFEIFFTPPLALSEGVQPPTSVKLLRPFPMSIPEQKRSCFFCLWLGLPKKQRIVHPPVRSEIFLQVPYLLKD